MSTSQLRQEWPDDDCPDVSGGGVPWSEYQQSTTACCPRQTIRGEYRRLRVGPYRVMYQVSGNVITIERVDRVT